MSRKPYMVFIDVSAIRSIARTASVRFPGDTRFIVSVNLMEELCTHQEKGEVPDLGTTSDRAYAQLRKIDSIRRLGLFKDPIRFEIESGRSTSDASLVDLADLTRAPLLSAWEQTMMQEHGKKLGSWLFHDLGITQERKDGLKRVQPVVGGGTLWPQLAGFMQSDRVQAHIEERAYRFGRSTAKRNGWKLSRSFHPAGDWLTFGLQISEGAYHMWRLLTHGEEKPSPSKRGNLAYDMAHVAHLAVCDGFLACDQMALNMARVCWPEKADSIYTYDQRSREVRVYQPGWAS